MLCGCCSDVALALFCSAHADGLGGSNEDEWLVLLPRDRLPLSGSLLEPPTGASLFAVVGLEFGASKRNRTLGLQQTQPPSDEPTFMAPLAYARASIDTWRTVLSDGLPDQAGSMSDPSGKTGSISGLSGQPSPIVRCMRSQREFFVDCARARTTSAPRRCGMWIVKSLCE